LAISSDSTVTIHNIDSKETLEIKAQKGKITKALWNPHSNTELGFLNDSYLKTHDVRSNKYLNHNHFTRSVHSIDAHRGQAKDLDFNPNRPHLILTCGEDRSAKLWDLRQPKQSVYSVCHHTHWVWGVKYNSFHDVLFLTCGSDSQVNLESAYSWSSAMIYTEPVADDEEQYE
jgi:WD40 repeat protein